MLFCLAAVWDAESPLVAVIRAATTMKALQSLLCNIMYNCRVSFSSRRNKVCSKQTQQSEVGTLLVTAAAF